LKITVVKQMDAQVSLIRDTEIEKRRLNYIPERCVGCGLCANVCPLNAISMGPIGAIARGEAGGPNLVIDEKACALCGICCTICPKRALTLFINGSDLKDIKNYPQLITQFTLDRKQCALYDESRMEVCTSCRDSCPAKAIEIVEIIPEREVSASCKDSDLTGMVNVTERAKYDLRIDEGLCCYCGRCVEECEEEVIKVQKPFEGRIQLDKAKCKACDACVLVCPAKAIEVVTPPKPYMKTDRYKIQERFCIFCGACEQACPVNAIKVTRTKLNMTMVLPQTWKSSWERAITQIAKS